MDGALRPRLLVAEDNRVNQKVVQRMLEKQGFRVDVAADGREALALWENLPYDLILMDCQMPEMDGYEATAAIRARQNAGQEASPARPKTPIVAMTANAMPTDREKCLAAGMDDYLTKPIREEQLLQVIRNLLPPAKDSRAANGAVADPLLARFGNDPEELRFAASLFLDEYPRLLALVRDAVARGETNAITDTAHALKGALLLFDAGAAAMAAGVVETAGRAGQPEAAKNALATLEAEGERLSAALKTTLSAT